MSRFILSQVRELMDRRMNAHQIAHCLFIPIATVKDAMQLIQKQLTTTDLAYTIEAQFVLLVACSEQTK